MEAMSKEASISLNRSVILEPCKGGGDSGGGGARTSAVRDTLTGEVFFV